MHTIPNCQRIAVRFLLAVATAFLSVAATAATLTVTTTADTVAADGGCSLREAIQNANANAAVNADCAAGSGADTIVFQSDVFQYVNGIGLNGTPLPVITDSLKIQGPHNPGLFRLGESSSRLFEIAAPDGVLINVTLANLALEGHAADSGGAVASKGANLNIVDSRLYGSAANGGALAFFGDHGATLTVIRGDGSGHADGSGGAFDLRNISAPVTLRDCRFGFHAPTLNATATVGGAINVSFAAGGSLVLTRCIFERNYSGQPADVGGFGGALNITSEVPGGAVVVEDSNFEANTADFVDEFGGPGTARDVGVGGAIAFRNVKAVIRRSFFGGNKASRGAAIAASATQLTLENVTINGNQSKSTAAPGSGTGALYLTDGSTAAVVASTFYRNFAESGGASITATAGSTVTLHNSIVSSRGADATAPEDVDAGGVPVAANYSMIGTTGSQSFAGTGNIFAADIDMTVQTWELAIAPAILGSEQLGALVPACGSVVIDRGDPAFASSATDGRGKARVVNGRVDIGATEFRPSVVAVAAQTVGERQADSIVATRTGDGGEVSAEVTCGGGTAIKDVDYRCASAVVWKSGEEGPKTVGAVINDALSETDETFTVSLAATGGCVTAGPPAVVTIVDDDPLPSLTIDSASRAEGDTGGAPLEFIVRVTPVSGQVVTVKYATASGSATAGTDFVAASGTLTFPAGMPVLTIPVTILGDTTPERDETFTLVLSSPTAATLVTKTATGTILNDDPLPADLSVSARFRPGAAFVGVPATYDVTVRNDGPFAAGSVTVTDVLPAGATLVTATPSRGNCSGTTTVICSVGPLAAGTAATVTIGLQPAVDGVLTNSVSASAAPQPDPSSANDAATASVTVQPASAIPTLSDWAKLLLALAIASAALIRVR